MGLTNPSQLTLTPPARTPLDVDKKRPDNCVARKPVVRLRLPPPCWRCKLNWGLTSLICDDTMRKAEGITINNGLCQGREGWQGKRALRSRRRTEVSGRSGTMCLVGFSRSTACSRAADAGLAGTGDDRCTLRWASHHSNICTSSCRARAYTCMSANMYECLAGSACICVCSCCGGVRAGKEAARRLTRRRTR